MQIGRVFPNFQHDLKYTEHYLAKEFAKDGDVTIFITSDKYPKYWKKYIKIIEPAGYYKYDNYEVYRLKSFFPLEKTIFKELSNLSKIIKTGNYDILHLSGLGTFTTIITLFLTFINNKKLPTIVSDHTDTRTHMREGLHANLYHLFFVVMLWVFKNKIKYIITFNDLSKNVLKRRFKLKEKKFKIIPLGFDQDTFYHNKNIKNTDEKFLIGFAGKVSKAKRVDFLIEALNKLEIRKQIKLIVIGVSNNDSYFEELKKLSLKVNYEIEFRPIASTELLAIFYNYIDLAIFPGGISITTIEANACGTPVIIYESIENLNERVEDGRGVLFKTENELLENIKLYYKLYKNGEINNFHIAETTANKYSWKTLKEEYKNIYKEVINEK